MAELWEGRCVQGEKNVHIYQKTWQEDRQVQQSGWTEIGQGLSVSWSVWDQFSPMNAFFNVCSAAKEALENVVGDD